MLDEEPRRSRTLWREPRHGDRCCGWYGTVMTLGPGDRCGDTVFLLPRFDDLDDMRAFLDAEVPALVVPF